MYILTTLKESYFVNNLSHTPFHRHIFLSNIRWKMNASVAFISLYNIPSAVQEVNLTSCALKILSMWKRKITGLQWQRQGSRQVLWEPEALAEQISGSWARAQPVSESEGESGDSRLKLSPSHEPDDIRQVTKLQTFFRELPRWYFQWLGIHVKMQGTQVRSPAPW